MHIKKVFLVDYGRTIGVKKEALRLLPRKLKEMKAQSVLCTMKFPPLHEEYLRTLMSKEEKEVLRVFKEITFDKDLGIFFRKLIHDKMTVRILVALFVGCRC